MWKNYLNDAGVALSLLTRIPLRLSKNALERSNKAVWAYGLAGAVWAVMVWSVSAIAIALGLGHFISVLLGLAAGTILTGAIHEDGLADSADGLWGGWGKKRRLEIMKDSTIGVYGAVALFFVLFLRWQLISHLFELSIALAALLTAGSFSRAVLGVIMVLLPNVRSDGLSHSVGRPKPILACFGVGISALAALLLLGLTGLIACVIGCITAWACAAIANHKISGQTGDILGATAILTEITIMIAIFSFAQ